MHMHTHSHIMPVESSSIFVMKRCACQKSPMKEPYYIQKRPTDMGTPQVKRLQKARAHGNLPLKVVVMSATVSPSLSLLITPKLNTTIELK